MNFRIADTFTGRLARLTGNEQKAARTTAYDLQPSPPVRGWVRAAPIGLCSALYPVRSGSQDDANPSLWSPRGPNVHPFHLRAG